MPSASPPFVELAAHSVREPLEKARVVHRVAQLVCAKRPARPIGFLPCFADLDAKVSLDQRGQAEPFEPEQLRRNHGIENLTARSKAHRPSHHAQIVVAAMENQWLLGERFQQSAQVQPAKRVDEVVLVGQRELNQTDLCEIVVQTIRLGVHGDPFRRAHALDQLCQRRALSNVNIFLGFRRIQRFDLLYDTGAGYFDLWTPRSKP